MSSSVAAAAAAAATTLCLTRYSSSSIPSFSALIITSTTVAVSPGRLQFRHRKSPPPKPNLLICGASRKPSTALAEKNDDVQRIIKRVVQTGLWIAEAVYILWLFLLPYAPGDPVWAISPATVADLLALSLNFFFILPFLNAVGIHFIEAPLLHPVSEGLFNFVIGWTFMFAPLLYTDLRRDRYKGSIDLLWGFMMFLTNTFLIPYMAIRLNDVDAVAGGEASKGKGRSPLSTVMTNGAPVVGIVGGAICLTSIIWSLYGRSDANFVSISERWEFLLSYIASERLAYAFVWDICLYIIFQPWLIGANLENVQKGGVNVVKYLRFVPVVGLVAYLLALKSEDE